MIQNLILDYDITKKLIEVQHDHILVRLDLDVFLEYVGDFVTSESPNSNALTSFVRSVKVKAQVNQVTLLVQNFKQHLR